MTVAHCLTIEVKCDTTPGGPQAGAGYMVAFTLPANMPDANPQEHPSFDAWSQAVRRVVIAASDQPFHTDPYTRKVALATLMDDLSELNRRFPLRIGGISGVPAVQIHSTDPQARQIEIDFTDEDGHFSVTEKNPQLAPQAEVREQGRLGLMPAARKNFPFDKPAGSKPPATSSARKPRQAGPR